MQAHSKRLITDYLLTIELRTVYYSQSGILINDIAANDYREKNGGCTPYQNAPRLEFSNSKMTTYDVS